MSTAFGHPVTFGLPLVWAMILGFAVLAYVVLDGFDLGIGILFPWTHDPHERDTMIASVAPVWDGNETWLVLGGGGLLAAFPVAYAIVLPALYAPLIAMLLALVFRGVAFEFRFRDPRHRPWWDRAFALGSIVATVAQGMVLGAFVQGIATDGRRYTGGWWDWLTPFSVFIALALLVGYALLGATWLVMKTVGPLRERMRARARRLGAALVAAVAIVSVWTPLLSEEIARRWFTWPNALVLAPLPLAVVVAAVVFARALGRDGDRREGRLHDALPFLMSLAVFALSYAGLAISNYPFVVPRAVTIEQAAAPESSLAFMLAGTAVLLPLILAYTGYSYWVFRGKADVKAGYH